MGPGSSSSFFARGGPRFYYDPGLFCFVFCFFFLFCTSLQHADLLINEQFTGRKLNLSLSLSLEIVCIFDISLSKS
jgi:hypothetical protein